MSPIPETYLPQDGKLFTISMGLRALDISKWLEVDEAYGADIARKRTLLETNRDQVFQAVDAGFASSVETLAMIESHWQQFSPSSSHASLSFHQHDATQGDQEHPLVIASLQVQEDLCVMTKIDDQWVLTAAVVCFPSRWDLTTKIGTNLHDIHAPVPHYEERIGSATDVMFDKFTADRPVWRINWTILDSPDLYQPASSHSSEAIQASDTSDAGQISSQEKLANLSSFAESTFLRIERQTLRVLPKSGDVLFTIRTYVDSLANVAKNYPDFREKLSATLAGVSDETKRYKGWESMWQAMNDWSSPT